MIKAAGKLLWFSSLAYIPFRAVERVAERIAVLSNINISCHRIFFYDWGFLRSLPVLFEYRCFLTPSSNSPEANLQNKSCNVNDISSSDQAYQDEKRSRSVNRTTLANRYSSYDCINYLSIQATCLLFSFVVKQLIFQIQTFW